MIDLNLITIFRYIDMPIYRYFKDKSCAKGYILPKWQLFVAFVLLQVSVGLQRRLGNGENRETGI